MIAVPGWEGMNIVIPGYRSLVPEEENGGEVVVRVKVPERAQR
jgi:hypothetical protein